MEKGFNRAINKDYDASFQGRLEEGLLGECAGQIKALLAKMGAAKGVDDNIFIELITMLPPKTTPSAPN